MKSDNNGIKEGKETDDEDAVNVDTCKATRSFQSNIKDGGS